jgi:hypothetical protein
MDRRRPTSRSGKPKSYPRRVIRKKLEHDFVEPDLEEAEAEATKWFGQSPWKVIGGAFLLAFLLFAPMCTVTDTVEETETIMVPGPTRTMPPPVPGEKIITVYQGYLIDIDGTTTTIDAVNGIVSYGKAIGRTVWGTRTWTITTTDTEGYQVVYRDIVTPELTKTGKLSVRTDATGAPLYTQSNEMVPKEVTKEKEIKSRISLIQWLFGSSCAAP